MNTHGLTLDERLDLVKPFDADAATEIARAYIAETGDLPESVFGQLCFAQYAPDDVAKRLQALRVEHFKTLGKKPPAYSGMLE